MRHLLFLIAFTTFSFHGVEKERTRSFFCDGTCKNAKDGRIDMYKYGCAQCHCRFPHKSELSAHQTLHHFNTRKPAFKGLKTGDY